MIKETHQTHRAMPLIMHFITPVAEIEGEKPDFELYDHEKQSQYCMAMSPTRCRMGHHTGPKVGKWDNTFSIDDFRG